MPRANKFQSKHFPLFETLGELYDGRTSRGILDLDIVLLRQHKSVVVVMHSKLLRQEKQMRKKYPVRPTASRKADEDEDSIRPTAARKQMSPAVPDGGKKQGSEKAQGSCSSHNHMMERHLEIKTKQVECEIAEQTVSNLLAVWIASSLQPRTGSYYSRR